MKTKYPRSFHLPYSPNSQSDDKKHSSDDHFIDKQVVVSLKMDGENTTIYNSEIHARSLDSRIDSEDRRWIDALRKSKIEGNIPITFRICGENLFYKHTCSYDDLESMFYVFSIWDEDVCLSWDETMLWCGLLELSTVPIIYEGVYDKDMILKEFSKHDNSEGFVIRIRKSFDKKDFTTSLSKYVKKEFVIPDTHWRHSKKTMNKLKSNTNPWESF